MYTYANQAYKDLDELIEKISPSKILVLDDENTRRECYPVFIKNFKHDHEHITIPAGENHKTLSTASGIWKKMLQLNLDRKSLLINLGGGIVTDMGGFVASTFKRGMPFVHVPTSLLGMVDASIGGKNGVNFLHAKNQIGVIVPPEMILIDPVFLNSLPKEEFDSGYAEMLKHALISDPGYWDELIKDFHERKNLKKNIKKSIEIKHGIISQDPYEKGLRKILNFGHTLGHALESYSHENHTPLTHGHAVALGMIMALYLSFKKGNLDFTFVNKAANQLKKIYKVPVYSQKDLEKIISYLIYDKKNISGEILFVLLKNPGEAVYNQKVSTEDILEAFQFLSE